MRTLSVRSALSLLAATLFLTACQSGFGNRYGGNRSFPIEQGFTVSSLNGTWRPVGGSAAGEYVSTFQDGRFVSRDPSSLDRNALLAQGVYTVTAPNIVTIDFIGAVSGRSVKANCQLPTPNQMACTPDVGAPFTLMRT